MVVWFSPLEKMEAGVLGLIGGRFPMPATFLKDEAVKTVEAVLTVEANQIGGLEKNVARI